MFTKLCVLLLSICLSYAAVPQNNLHELGLMSFMMQSRDLTQDDPTRSLSCFDYYVPILKDIADEYQVEYTRCLDVADAQRLDVDESTKPDREAIEDSASSSCAALQNCNENSSSIPFFECYAEAGSENAKSMFTISANASELLAKVREEYRLIDVNQYVCTNKTEREYAENTAETYEELSKCLAGAGVPVATSSSSAPASSTTSEPSTAEPSPSEPSTAEPSPSEPSTAEPSPSEPSTAEPSPSEPSTAEPSTAEPSPSEPSPSEPSPSEPSPSEPSTAEPSPSEPSTDEPSPSEPSPSEPSPSEPSTAEPSPSEPSTDEPSPSEPSPSEPSPSESSPSEPSPTDGPTDAPEDSSPSDSSESTANSSPEEPSTEEPSPEEDIKDIFDKWLSGWKNKFQRS
ncbi:proteoglycan 4 [Scaptodrosophila lebanonensis]|uniref:Proteoglycan 4 n=1 Tax=Drosophila lebanonensis TaxID=7225 RepID=A0A6J2U3B6_DROLE|nr:proteoglycan 4 [Scaptodrosophila lebanonensis]